MQANNFHPSIDVRVTQTINHIKKKRGTYGYGTL